MPPYCTDVQRPYLAQTFSGQGFQTNDMRCFRATGGVVITQSLVDFHGKSEPWRAPHRGNFEDQRSAKCALQQARTHKQLCRLHHTERGL